MRAETKSTLEPSQIDMIMSTLNEAVLALAPNDLTTNRLPSALAEIGAARMETDAAAMQILDAADALILIAADLGGSSGDKVITATDIILQACSMNDIVGQRLAKAVAAIVEARNRLAVLADAIGLASEAKIETADDARVRENLTFGPSLNQVVQQSDVDKLFI